MIPLYQYSSFSNSQEIDRLGEIMRQCFGSSPSDWERYVNLLSTENFRILRQGDRIIAGLAIYQMGQWFGGQNVPLAGIAAVGVAPEARGKGAARELLTKTIQELYSSQIAISALYPATQALYRQVGYEQGGSYCKWELPIASIQLKERDLSMYKVSLRERHLFENTYNQQAQINNGNLARHSAIWTQILESEKEKEIYAYLIGSETAPEGYIIFTQNETTIEIRDWVLLNAWAARRLWTFLADHRSMIETVIWRGASVNPFTLLLPEQTAKITSQMIWLLRIVNVPLALSLRGYPTQLEAELHLDVRDDLIAANNGKFCLKVSQGRGEVSQGGKGYFQIDIRSLASLYTSFLSPQQQQRLGYLQTTSEALETANLIFFGDRPWMADFF
ncbi:GNAT family N-acetyltransferase [Hyella patelloides LEGE 07179]|uniref:GNAT family N-acetyltransferase n=1 Tax=Hyella patelloides LEGE 07179 TaxID=945734 RepID=A0A563VKN1_9CYAN|nr:GNAT family N-acetyltransferase [Hyella patelloides]VEP11893.1 GNAT family N-acetyltransferase [Hyella patelloides LEGE 07179]